MVIVVKKGIAYTCADVSFVDLAALARSIWEHTCFVIIICVLYFRRFYADMVLYQSVSQSVKSKIK